MIWLIGNKGMLGRDVEKRLSTAQLPYFASDIEVDITDPAAPAAFKQERSPGGLNWIINCAAYTAVDKAEDERETAFRINADGPAHLARLARETGAALLHISTDYVFDGSKQGVYKEADAPCPLGVYGASKWEGEQRITETCARHYILRTAWLYGKHGRNFVCTMLGLFKTRKAVGVVADQWGSPTYTKDLADAIVRLIAHENKAAVKHYGLYHFSNEGKTNWFAFTQAISRLALQYGLIGEEIEINPVTTAQFPVKAKRPANSLLSKNKIQAAFGLEIRPWEEALEDFIAHEAKDG